MSSLTSRVFLACAFVAVLSIALGTRFVTVRVSREAESELRRNLKEAADLLERHHLQRNQTLALSAGLVADLPKLKAAVATGDGPTVSPLARDYQRRLGSDLLVITDSEGKVLASSGSEEPVVGKETIEHARRGEASSYIGETTQGVLQMVTLPIVVGPEPPEMLGTLSVGFFLNDQLAHELSSLIQSDVVLGYRGRAVASTIPVSPAEAQSVLEGGATRAVVGKDEYVMVRRTLKASNASEGLAVVVLMSRGERLAFLHTFREGLLLSALAGVLLATVLSYAVARTVTRPLAAITETMREMTTTGDLARKIELGGPLVDEDATVLARAFNRLTESIARFQREAASRERLSALGRMSTVIAHEIRNPLMIIKASVRILTRKGLSPGELREAAEDIDHEVSRLNRIVGDVLDFARPIELDLQTTDLNSICRSAAEAVLIEERSPSFEMRLDDRIPLLVTDGERLRTALVNILANAIEAVEAKPRRGDGAPRPDIELETRWSEEGKAEIVVRDRGVGIPPEDLPKIFEPYFTAKRTGTGLGLAITKNIIESLGGKVVAESRPAEGSELRVELFLEARREGGRASTVVAGSGR